MEIVERSLEFCLLHLEKSSYVGDDFGLLVSSIGLVLNSWGYHSEFEYAFGTLVAGALLIHTVGLNSEKLLKQTLTTADSWASKKKIEICTRITSVNQNDVLMFLYGVHSSMLNYSWYSSIIFSCTTWYLHSIYR